MKQVTFKRLSVEDFKGITKKELEFSDGVTAIFGVNRSGKTSLADSLYWVLFGKSLLGDTRFGIMPIDKLTAIPCVQLEIEVDGVPHTLTRKLKNGSTSDCMIDGVPTPLRAYEQWVEQNIMPIERFKLFSNPLYFPSLGWQEQRALFTDFFEKPSMESVLSAMERDGIKLSGDFEKLIRTMKPEDIQAKMINEIKELEAQKTRKQAVADHLTEEISAAGSISVEELEAERETLTTKWDEAEKEAKKRVEARKPLDDARIKLDTLQNEADNIKFAIRKILNAKQLKINELATLIKATESQVRSKTAEWQQAQAKVVSTVCPACGQAFPADRVNAGEEAKKKLIAQIEEEGKMLREKLNEYNKVLEEAEAVECSELERQYAEKCAEVKEQEAHIKQLESAAEPAPRESIHGMRVRLDEIGKQLAEAGKIGKKTAERDELIRDIEKTVREIEMRERTKKDAGQYILYQAKVTVEAVNAQFNQVKIELFEYQKNGVVKPTFKLLFNGVNFQDTSSTERVLIGLEINEYLKKALDISVPTIIDNFESYRSIPFEALPKQSIVTLVSAEEDITIVHK
jgi:DNA repair exonuclease SbcCD ATPase subunit